MTPEIKQRIEQIQNGIVPKGYKQTPFGIYPANWVVGKLGDYIEEYSVLSNEIETYPVYSSSRKGLLLQSQYFDNREAVKTNLGYKMVPSGYVTYRHMSDDDIFYFNRNTTGKTILVSSEYPVFTNSEYGCLDYLITLLNNTSRFRYFCRTQKMGGTRTRLYFKRLCQYRTVFPHITEQLKISEILNTQDKVIELTEKRIEQLKQIKKYYLQNMFPKRGETVPKIRFKGFTEAWEQRKVGDIAGKTYGGGTPKTSVNEFWGGSIPWIQSSNLLEDELFAADIQKYITESGLLKSATQLVPRDSIAVVSHVGVGKLVFMPFEYTTSQDFISLSELNTDPVFTCYTLYRSLQQDLHIVQGSAIKGITKDTLLGKIISVPNTPEQTRIGSALRNIDNLITLHQRKLEEEKRKKKSLAQLLLSGIVRDKV